MKELEKVQLIAEIATKAICILVRKGIVSEKYLKENLNTREEILDYLISIETSMMEGGD